MLVERKYPLSKELLQRMLDFGLEVEVESTAALDLIRVLNSPCFMVKSWLVQDQTVLGKDYSNLLIADSLLKTIWFINAPCYGNEALASPKANELTIPEQTATGKGISNPFMADADAPPPPPPPPSQTPSQQTPHTVSTIKLPILKKGEYDIWAMKMEHYLAHTDYLIWEVIQRGNSTVSVSTDTNGLIMVSPPKTAKETLARERERKARTTLLMALPEDLLAKFHKMTDAKEMWEAIKSIFSRNDESKKMQKYILKQQFEGFSISNLEGLHKGYDRFQSLLSQLEIHGAGVSTEDANQKFLRSLPSSWSQVSLIMRTKPGVDSLSFDDLYNNLRVFEFDVKGSTASSSSTQNVAFISENTSITNDLDEFDLEEIDLKWQVAMISMRMKKFYKKTGRKLQFDAKEPVGFDKTKVECYSCHKTGHFARECRSKGNQDSRRRDTWNTGNKDKENGRRSGKQEDWKRIFKKRNKKKAKSKQNRAWNEKDKRGENGRVKDSKALMTLDGECVDWTSHSEDEQENYALMACNSSGSDTEMSAKDKAGLGYGDQMNKSVLSYENEVFQSVFVSRTSDIEDSHVNDRYAEGMHAQSKPSESDTRSSDFNSCESNCSEETHEFVPVPVVNEPKVVSEPKVWSDAPITEEYESDSEDEHVSLPTEEQEILSFAFINIDKHVKTPRQTVIEQNTCRQTVIEQNTCSEETHEFVPVPVVNEPKVVSEPKVWSDAPITEEYESDSEDEHVSLPTEEQEIPSFAFFNTDKHVKTPRQTVIEQNTCSQSPKPDKKDCSDLMSKRLGLGFGYTKKACFVCGSFSHLIRDCDFHEKMTAKQAELNNRMSKGSSQREIRLVWNNVQRMNHQNQFVPKAVLTRTGKIPVNTARTSVNIVKPIVNNARPKAGFHKSISPFRKSFNRTTTLRTNFSKQKVNTAEDYPHRALQNKGIVDSGCSRHMTGNKAYLAEYQDFNGGPVAFGGSKGYITGKGKIKTGKLDFEDVCFVKELQHFNLFSVSQMCDKKNKVLFTDSECLVLSPEFKLPDENQVLLRIPRQNNMYSFNLENIVPSGGLACLIAKATIDESNKWHRRLGHVNFKNLNKLVKGNLVRGLPSKIFQNDHTCVACQKGKQHKASCKAKSVSSISHSLQLLHMDLFGPTSVRSLNHKTYCLVITDDFSRFSWVFFLRTKDETSGILKDFIRQIENQLNQKVKTIRCDNGTEFKNRDFIEFCGSKGIKREYSNARTPQQNGVAERKNRTLIEAARTMLADSFLPNTFWAEAVSTACYVLNRVLVTKPQNKTPYELITGKGPTWLFDLDYLTDSMNYQPMRSENQANLFNELSTYEIRETKRVEENLHITFLENKPNVAGKGPTWLFDLDYLTDSMNYQPMRSENQANKHAGPQEANHNAGTKDNINAGDSEIEVESAQDYFVLPIWSSYTSTVKSIKAKNAAEALRKEFAQDTKDLLIQARAAKASSTNIVNTASTPVCTASPYGGLSFTDLTNTDQDDSEIPTLEEIYKIPTDGIFTNESYDDEGVVADFTNLETIMNVSHIPTSRINSIHPSTLILKDPKSAVQTRSKVTKSTIDSEIMETKSFISKLDKVSSPEGDYLVVYRVNGNFRAFNYLMENDQKDWEIVTWRLYEACGVCILEFKDGTVIHMLVERKYPLSKELLQRMLDFGLEVEVESTAALDLIRFIKQQLNEEYDYARENLDRKSTTGGCQFLGRRLISWQCKKQTIMATSTTEAEYVAATNCCGQVLWIQNQMLDYGFNFMNTKIYIDNESTICIVKNLVFHSKTKHIAIRHHFKRDAYEKKLIQVLKIHTDDNVVDLLTKAFDVSRFQFLVVTIRMINP
ncbi:putative ribonuclease H-like domain-containing protein [Tanacetum coccineum]